MASGSPLNPSQQTINYVLGAPVLQLGQDAEPEFGAFSFAVADPQPEDVFAALDIDANG